MCQAENVDKIDKESARKRPTFSLSAGESWYRSNVPARPLFMITGKNTRRLERFGWEKPALACVDRSPLDANKSFGRNYWGRRNAGGQSGSYGLMLLQFLSSDQRKGWHAVWRQSCASRKDIEGRRRVFCLRPTNDPDTNTHARLKSSCAAGCAE